LTFIAIQATYLFGGQTNVGAHGLTYAEYARKGFLELIVVASISLLIIWSRKNLILQNSRQALLCKILSLTLAAEVLVILASAFTRLSLYEQAYGFTTFRFYSYAFIIWLTAILILLFYIIATGKKENLFAFYGFLSIIVGLAIINIINPDAIIARNNIERFGKTPNLSIDICYLSNLSADAMPEVIKALELSHHKRASGLLARSLNNRLNYYSKDWQSYNLSRENAKKIIIEHRAAISQGDSYIGNCENSMRD